MNGIKGREERLEFLVVLSNLLLHSSAYNLSEVLENQVSNFCQSNTAEEDTPASLSFDSFDFLE